VLALLGFRLSLAAMRLVALLLAAHPGLLEDSAGWVGVQLAKSRDLRSDLDQRVRKAQRDGENRQSV
jgi:hypothetical protein